MSAQKTKEKKEQKGVAVCHKGSDAGIYGQQLGDATYRPWNKKQSIDKKRQQDEPGSLYDKCAAEHIEQTVAHDEQMEAQHKKQCGERP